MALKAAQDNHPQNVRVLYIISDGEQTSAESVKSFSVLRKYVDEAVVIGVGSTQGGKIPSTQTGINAMSEQTTTAWVQDPDTQQDGIFSAERIEFEHDCRSAFRYLRTCRCY